MKIYRQAQENILDKVISQAKQVFRGEIQIQDIDVRYRDWVKKMAQLFSEFGKEFQSPPEEKDVHPTRWTANRLARFGTKWMWEISFDGTKVENALGLNEAEAIAYAQKIRPELPH